MKNQETPDQIRRFGNPVVIIDIIEKKENLGLFFYWTSGSENKISNGSRRRTFCHVDLHMKELLDIYASGTKNFHRILFQKYCLPLISCVICLQLPLQNADLLNLSFPDYEY
jgi:hypothetical protein